MERCERLEETATIGSPIPVFISSLRIYTLVGAYANGKVRLHSPRARSQPMSQAVASDIDRKWGSR